MAYRFPVHLRINHWRIGEYDTITRNDEIIVGQLAQMNNESKIGIFRGFVIHDMQATGREGQAREWKHQLCTSEPRKVTDKFIKRYEAMIDDLPENK